MLHQLLIPTLLALLHLAQAIPHPSTRNDRPPQTERWLIPRLDLHFMTTDTGLPGGQWPPGTEFDTTISLDLILPLNHTIPLSPNFSFTNCSASWPNGSFPTADMEFPCTSPSDRENVTFMLSPFTGRGERKPELSFTLGVLSRIDYNGTGSVGSAFYYGGVDVTANEPGVETSYLTCLLGRPYDGMRCGLKGVMSWREDLEVEVEGYSLGDDGGDLEGV
jgi:hypothetical protein